MAFWAAAIPALKAAAPWIAKAGGAALSFVGSNNLFGGSSDDSPEGSGITYQPSVVTGQVPTNNFYSKLAGNEPQGLYGRLIQ